MSGETEKEVSGWTVDTLHTHMEVLMAERDVRYEQRFIAQERAATLALNAQKEATHVAEEAAQRWRDAANEWRSAMNDREKMFMPRIEAERLVQSSTERIRDMATLIDKLEQREDRRTGKQAGVGSTLTIAVSAIGALILVINFAFFLISR